jgi:hypothetical protein
VQVWFNGRTRPCQGRCGGSIPPTCSNKGHLLLTGVFCYAAWIRSLFNFMKEQGDRYNPNSPEIQENDSNTKIANIEFDDKSTIEVAYTEKIVNFPEYLVTETGGVKGYIRKRVEWKDYNQALEEIISTQELKELGLLCMEINPDFPIDYSFVQKNREAYLIPGSDDLDMSKVVAEAQKQREAKKQKIAAISSIDSIEALQEINQIIGSSLSILSRLSSRIANNDDKIFAARIGNERCDQLRISLFKAVNLLYKTVEMLGDNFIDNTNVHVMGGIYLPRNKQGATEEFTKQGLAQVIFDPTLTLNPDQKYELRSVIEPGKIVGKRLSLPEDDDSINFDQYKNELRENETFLISDTRLAVSNGGIWGLDGRKDSMLHNAPARPIFGFGKENLAYIKYLKSVLNLFSEIEPKRPEDRLIIQCLTDLLQYGRSNTYSPFGDTPHPEIPIVIGHSGIHELRWCHASDAYIPTKNGINIIKMISE